MNLSEVKVGDRFLAIKHSVNREEYEYGDVIVVTHEMMKEGGIELRVRAVNPRNGEVFNLVEYEFRLHLIQISSEQEEKFTEHMETRLDQQEARVLPEDCAHGPKQLPGR